MHEWRKVKGLKKVGFEEIQETALLAVGRVLGGGRNLLLSVCLWLMRVLVLGLGLGLVRRLLLNLLLLRLHMRPISELLLDLLDLFITSLKLFQNF